MPKLTVEGRQDGKNRITLDGRKMLVDDAELAAIRGGKPATAPAADSAPEPEAAPVEVEKQAKPAAKKPAARKQAKPAAK